MNLYIDCEFNGKGGALISMALVADDSREFYEVVECNEPIQPWVAENVMPILGKEPIGRAEFQKRLTAFIGATPRPNIVADWPVDVGYFCEWVIVGEYPNCSAAEFATRVLSLPNAPPSKLPHNALADARAIRDALHFSP